MKIAFLGNFRESYTSETHYLKTLRKLGCEVFPLQEGTDNIHQVMSRAIKMDMLFWVHTHGWNTEGMREALQILKEQNIPTIGYHLDLWMGIAREKDLQTDPYWDIDYFFSVDKLMVDFLNSREDMPKAFYLPAGVFEDECYIAPREEWRHDIVFVGSKRYHPEWKYRTELINWLEATYGNKFALYGRDGRGIIRGHELNQLYSSSKIVIGDTLCKNFNYPYYLSDRIFETMGRGGFIIHPYIEGLETLYNTQEYTSSKRHETNTDNAHLITYPFNNFDYLKYLIDYYLDNDKEREAIRKRGYEYTKKHHTYTNRLNYLLETIQNERENKPTHNTNS